MDELSFWEKALTQEDIIKLMFKKLTGKEEKLLLYLPFDEGRGQAIKDLSQNSFHGTVHGNPNWKKSSEKPMIFSAKY